MITIIYQDKEGNLSFLESKAQSNAIESLLLKTANKELVCIIDQTERKAIYKSCRYPVHFKTLKERYSLRANPIEKLKEDL